MMRWIDNKQYICFDIKELFAWQDALDELEGSDFPKCESWVLFNDFLAEAENQLEYSEEFIHELESILEANDE